MQTLKLIETKHPTPRAEDAFNELVGLDFHKEELLQTLELLLDGGRASAWASRHHPGGLGFLDRLLSQEPLVLLTGDVGCGKTALATSVGSALAKRLDEQVVVWETPSDIRGSGHVGELSLRLTAVFDQVKGKLTNHRFGLLIMDEGDDLAASRDQDQAHHEDRAGVNVLIKEIGKLAREDVSVVLLLITNRPEALDPAIVRRAALHLRFDRPGLAARRALISRLLPELPLNMEELDILAESTERTPSFTYSDLVNRWVHSSLVRALRADEPLSFQLLLESLETLEPSPEFG